MAEGENIKTSLESILNSSQNKIATSFLLDSIGINANQIALLGEIMQYFKDYEMHIGRPYVKSENGRTETREIPLHIDYPLKNKNILEEYSKISKKFNFLEKMNIPEDFKSDYLDIPFFYEDDNLHKILVTLHFEYYPYKNKEKK